jgi:lysophospholipid acyltransferase (LPLAT)-like uncharacterized protein
MALLKRLGRKRWVQTAAGIALAEYLRFVTKSSRVVFEPADIHDRLDADLPVIFAMWHGQHGLVPFMRKPEHRAKVLFSRHRDGEINAIAAQRLGLGAIRGSGDHGNEFRRKGGVTAFMQMLEALNEGYSMALTADVPKIARVAGAGIVKLAQKSGRPIYPVAVATQRRLVLANTWDKSVINLPFGRCVCVVRDPIRVDRDADEPAAEAKRLELEHALNAATERAYALADGREAIGHGDHPHG